MTEPIEFKALGPFEVLRGGEQVDLGPYKQRSLLMLLLANANQVVSTDRITDGLWGDEAGGKENALQVYISRLRSVLEPDRTGRGESSVLLTKEPGYILAVDPERVDFLRFEHGLSKARDAIETDASGALQLLDDALGLWRGDALADFAYESFSRNIVDRLDELRLDASELRFDAQLRLGHAGDLVSGLEAFARDNPFRETPVGQLMAALYRAGRQAEALRAFERHRRILSDELGIEPSPELRRLEEMILLHDESLVPAGEPRTLVAALPGPNPYRGLHAFREVDEANFFGRESLVAELLRRIEGGDRLIAVVGPSGSGKSSVVHAGLVPRVRKRADRDGTEWVIAQMVPGAHPFTELEAALLRARLDGPDSLSDQLAGGDEAILRAGLRVLPEGDARLLLVIDQFEELFTLVEDRNEQRRFLDGLLLAMDEPHGRIAVVLTLRADFYDRPLLHPAFGARLGQAIVNVTPLTSHELEVAASQPAIMAGVRLEPALLGRLLADVVDQPGALPMFQYALTELYERRSGEVLTESAYQELGGVRGAITHRAEELYNELRPDEQAAAEQLFLRLVSMSDEETWSRRRVRAEEIISLDVDIVTLQAVIDRFGAHRLLFFDRDKATGSPTVELGHEALLNEWPRLDEWVHQARHDLLRHGSFVGAVNEWERANRDSGYLVTGARLAEYERWAASSAIELNARELEFLGTALEAREAEVRLDQERSAREVSLAGRARRRLWALVALVTVLVGGVGVVLLVAGTNDKPEVAVVHTGRGDNSLNDLTLQGLEESARLFDIVAIDRHPPWSSIEDVLRNLAEGGTDLIVTDWNLGGGFAELLAPQYPDTKFVVFFLPEGFGGPNVVGLQFAESEGAYLAGVAAALETTTGTIGFVGAAAGFDVDEARTGFEAGARFIDPDIQILVRYLLATGDLAGSFLRPDLGKAAAADLFERGADIAFHRAGSSGFGVIEAAREATDVSSRPVWAIGSDSDQFFDVSAEGAAHVLTSIVRKFDVAVINTVDRLMNDQFEPGPRVLTVADSALDYSTSGNKLAAATIATLEGVKQAIIDGTVFFPLVPNGPVLAPLGHDVLGTINLTINEDGCLLGYSGPDLLPGGAALRLDIANNTAEVRAANVASLRFRQSATVVEALPGETASGYVVLGEGEYGVECGPNPEQGFRMATIVDNGAGGFQFERNVAAPQDPPIATGTPYGGKTIQGGRVLTIGATAYDLSPRYNGGEGFDADLITEMAERMGLATEIRETASGNVFEILAEAGTDYDLFLTLAITDDRADLVNFTVPYFRDLYALLVNPVLRPDIRGLDDLGEGDVVDAGGPTTAGHIWAQENLSDAGVTFGFSYAEGLASGSIAAIIDDEPILSLEFGGHPTFEIVEVLDSGTASGFAVDPGNAELLEALNGAFQEMVADGTYQEIYDRWFDRPEASVAR